MAPDGKNCEMDCANTEGVLFELSTICRQLRDFRMRPFELSPICRRFKLEASCGKIAKWIAPIS